MTDTNRTAAISPSDAGEDGGRHGAGGWLPAPVGGVLLILVLSGVAAGQETAIDRAMDEISRLNYNEAAGELEQFLTNNPEDARGWYLLGLCRNRLELYEEAYAALTNASSFGARTPELHRELGYALQGMERWTAALSHLRKADPDDSGAWMARAQIQLKRKKYDEAERALTKVIETNGNLAGAAHLLRARVLAVRGNTKLAKQELKTGLRLVRRSDVTSSYRNLGRLLEVLDREVMKRYNAIFYREEVQEEEGVIVKHRRDEELRMVLSKSVSRYHEETEEDERTPAGFRAFVRETDPLARADRLMENLRDLFTRLDALDLTEKQARNLRLMIVRPIPPDAVTSEFLVDAIAAGEDG